MSHSEDKHLDFVLKHYKEGTFDTQKAIERFKDAQGIKPAAPRRLPRFLIYGISAAAAVVLGVFLFINYNSRQWTEITAKAPRRHSCCPTAHA